MKVEDYIALIVGDPWGILYQKLMKYDWYTKYHLIIKRKKLPSKGWNGSSESKKNEEWQF